MIGIVGLNHRTAPVEVRERFVLQEGDIERFVAGLKQNGDFDEVVILSTCNRTEIIYYVQAECGPGTAAKLVRELADFQEIEADFKEHFYTHIDDDAVEHLLSVAAGLNSLVLGENQVLGQVKEAYRISAERKYTGAVLNRLFHKAFEAGKRVRSETAINQGASSVGYAAVEVAYKIFGDLGRHTVLLVGAGETGELVVQSLVARGCKSVFITNRTASKAQILAEKYCAAFVDFASFKDRLALCDIVVTSTASKTQLIELQDVKLAAKKRKDRPIFLIDLSVPRDIDEKARDIENVFLYNIDDLEQVVAHNYERRKSEIEKAVQITGNITSDFLAWLSNLKLVPTISSLQHKINSIAELELKNLSNKMTDQEHSKVSKFAYFLNKKYLSLIIKNLKILSNNGRKLEYVQLVNDLFELPEKDSDAGA